MSFLILGQWTFDGCLSTHYLAENVDEGLPEHVHFGTNHTCKVEEGEVMIEAQGRRKILGPLENPVELLGDVPHSITATKPNTRFTNTLVR